MKGTNIKDEYDYADVSGGIINDIKKKTETSNENISSISRFILYDKLNNMGTNELSQLYSTSILPNVNNRYITSDENNKKNKIEYNKKMVAHKNRLFNY
jgi:hypothetical protein